MTHELLLVFFIIILTIEEGLEFWLDELNRRHWSPQIPEFLKPYYNSRKYTKAMKYENDKRRLHRIYSAFTFFVIITILSFGILGTIDGWFRNYTTNAYILPLLFFGAIGFTGDLISIPFSAYSTFVIEQKYGFNKTTVKTFIGDIFKGWLVTLILGGGLALALLWFYYKTGSFFWLWAWGTIVFFSLFMLLFYSNIIVPLFNKQTPLEDGELREKIEQFAAKVGFKLKDIYTIDGSKRSSKANAYFTGLGPKKRIVLYDTLIDQLEPDEVVAVLAHEIGHYKKKHITKSFIVSVITMGAMFYLFSLFLENPIVCKALGSDYPSIHLSVLGISLLFTPASLVISIISNYFSRKNEFQADRFAYEHGLGNSLSSALIKLSVNHLSNLNPHPWYVFVHYSHPPMLKRIERLKS